MGYSTERREAVLKERPPSVHKPVLERAGKEGISMATLYKWHKQARMEAPLLPDRSAVEGGSSQQVCRRGGDRPGLGAGLRPLVQPGVGASSQWDSFRHSPSAPSGSPQRDA